MNMFLSVLSHVGMGLATANPSSKESYQMSTNRILKPVKLQTMGHTGL
jgi:hypothetical protein